MHILMTADTLGGVFSYATTLIAWLTARGVRVTLATMGAPPSADQERIAREAGARVEPSSYKLEWMQEPWHDVWGAGDWLLELERAFSPDIVHLNGYVHAALPFRAPTLVVAHSCVLSWWRAVLGEPVGPEYARYREEVCRGLNAAGLVIAPSKAMGECLAREYGFRRARVIYNAAPAPAVPADKEPFVLCAGRLWDAAKNVDLVANVAPRLPWPVLVAGGRRAPDGGGGELPASVRALGNLPREQLWGWMQRASIFASPARYEPFGLSILEAAARGCALVLGDIPSLRELWHEAAIFVDPNSDASLERALEKLIEDAELRSRLALRASARARRYHPNRMGAAYLRSYAALLPQARESMLREAWS